MSQSFFFERKHGDAAEAAKIAYIDCILSHFKERTKYFLKEIESFEIAHKKQTHECLHENLNLLKNFIPALSISESVWEYEDFVKISKNCDLISVLDKIIWICKENGFTNLKIIFIMSMMLPLDNATCERYFLLLKNIKTEKRNRLSESILFDLMHRLVWSKFLFRFSRHSTKNC